MILYLDTSALVKLFVEEAGSALVRNRAEEAEILATCRVAYPETVSAINRRLRAGDVARSDYDALRKAFTEQWTHFAVVDFDELTAGRLAEKHGLRGFDAVHLSAALLLKASRSNISLAFMSFDEKLNSAAAAEKLKVLSLK